MARIPHDSVVVYKGAIGGKGTLPSVNKEGPGGEPDWHLDDLSVEVRLGIELADKEAII